MKVNFTADANGRLQNITTYPIDMEKPALEMPDDFDLQSIRDYVLSGGALKHDPFVTVPSAAEQIAALKRQLAETDYIAAKAVDAMAAADSLPGLLIVLKTIRMEYADVLAQRAEWRAEINKLEETGDDA